MTLRELAAIINGYLERSSQHGDDRVVIPLASPSIGFAASTDVVRAHTGIDWDHGRFFLGTVDRVVKKSQEEDAFDAARDLLMYLATKPMKRPTHEVREAQRILKRVGYTEEQFKKYAHLFHEVKKDGLE